MKRIKVKQNRGVTFIEVIVVVGIVGVLTALSIGNFREFEKRNVLGNLAQDVSLSIRLAQVYGLNVRGANAGVDEFYTSYGVHFVDGSNTYHIYRDVDRGDDGAYVYEGVGDRVEEFTIGGGYTIDDVCAQHSTGEHCFQANDITWLDIAFDRPKPDAIFTSSDGGAPPYGGATIDIRGPAGTIRTVEVLPTGYIAVQ